MLAKLKGGVDSKNVIWAHLTAFSKVFDCLWHELIFVKLNPYGLSLSVSIFLHDYLSKRQQGTKIIYAES